MRVVDLGKYGFDKEAIDLLSFPCSPYLSLDNWEIEELLRKKEWLDILVSEKQEFSILPGLSIPKRVPILLYSISKIGDVLEYFIFYKQREPVVVPVWYHRRYGVLKLVLSEDLEVGYRFNDGKVKKILNFSDLKSLDAAGLCDSLSSLWFIKNCHVSNYYVAVFIDKVFKVLTI